MTSSKAAEASLTVVGSILFLCAVAVVLNSLVILVIAKRGPLRSAVDIFMINLAISGILLVAVVQTLHFRYIFLDDGNFYGGNEGNVLCKTIMFIPKFIIMSTIVTLVAIASDRYRVMIHQKVLQRRGALISVGIIWLVAACFSAPQLYEYNVYKIENSETNTTLIACGSEGIVEHFETIYASVFLLAYLIALMILTACYGRITYFVWKHARRFQATQSRLQEGVDAAGYISSPLGKKISARKIRVLKMLASVTVTFILLWTPYFILFAMQEIVDMDHTIEFGKWPHVVTRTMTVISTIINPTLYLVFSDQVQKVLSNLLHCRLTNADSHCHTTSQLATSVCQIEASVMQSISSEIQKE